ncbi:MAG: hypothetical protein MZU84_08150 [Sphingobacterium sp.]|nr:hypothetical protein [Sphingobacterium sp.]
MVRAAVVAPPARLGVLRLQRDGCSPDHRPRLRLVDADVLVELIGARDPGSLIANARRVDRAGHPEGAARAGAPLDRKHRRRQRGFPEAGVRSTSEAGPVRPSSCAPEKAARCGGRGPRASSLRPN